MIGTPIINNGPAGPPTALTSLTVGGVPTMGVAGIPFTTGNYWFVGPSGSNGNPGSSTFPLATIEQALLKASSGDVIVLQPGFAETISSAGQITIPSTLTGVTIWGVGEGPEAPTLTSKTSTAATILVQGAGTTIGGSLYTICDIASQVTFFSVQAADVSISATHFDTSSVIGLLSYIVTTAAASNFFANVTYNGFTASTLGTTMIKLVGVVDGIINVNAYGAWSTAVVDFATTACVNIQVYGYMYNNSSSAANKDVVDTITGSTWAANFLDGQAGYQVVGGSAAAVGPAYPSSTIFQVPTANATTNVYERDVIGNKTDAAVYNPTTTASLEGYTKGASDLQENISVTGAAVMTNGLALFTIAGGPIEIVSLISICDTANSATASTLQYSSTGTLGTTTQTISGASASLASATAGTTVMLQGTALSTAPLVNANAANIQANASSIIVPAGSITAVVGTGSTTGTWTHYLRYRPLAKGVTVTNAF